MFSAGNTITAAMKSSPASLTVGILAAAVIGGVVPFYVDIMGDSFARLVALPALVLLGFLLTFSRGLLLMLILLFRASGDVAMAATKFNLAGIHVGIGGLINAFVLLIALLLVFEKPGQVPKKIYSMWSLFLLVGMFGIMLAPSKSDAIRLYLGMLSNFAVFVGSFYLARSEDGFGFCARLVLWSSVVPVLYSPVDLLSHGGGLSGFRLKSTFAHPNIFAFYLTLVISLSLYLLKREASVLSAKLRAALTLYIGVLLILLLLTQTRSAWVACFALFFLYGLFFERRYLIYLIIAPFLALLIPSVQERLLSLGEGNEYVQYAKLNSFAWRVLMWETGLKWMQTGRYLLGYGLDSFRNFSPIFFPLSGGAHMGAHSVYVQLFFELGSIGLVAFLWLFIRAGVYLKSMFGHDRLAGFTAVVLIVEYLTVSISDNMLFYLVFNWYFWFIVGSAIATAFSYKQASKLCKGSVSSERRFQGFVKVVA